MVKNTIVYTISSVISSAFPFLLLPILTRSMSEDEYGMIAMLTIFISALNAFVGVGAFGASSRKFFDEGITELKLARFNGNCLYVLFASTILVLLSSLLLRDELVYLLGIPTSWLYFALFIAFFSFLVQLRLTQWQVRSNVHFYGLVQIGNSLVATVLTVILIVFLDIGADGRVYSLAAASLIFGTLCILSLVKDKLIYFKINKRDIKEILNYGVPLIPHVFGGVLLLSFDRIIISRELGVGMAGIYMSAVTLASVLNVMLHSFNRAYSPWLFSLLSGQGQVKKTKIVDYTYIYFSFLLVLGLCSFWLGPYLFRIVVGYKFHGAANVFPVILMGQCFLGMYLVVTNYVFYAKRTKYLSYITILTGGLNCLLLFYTIPHWGISGAAYSFCFSNFIQFLLTWILSNSAYRMPWFYFLKGLENAKHHD